MQIERVMIDELDCDPANVRAHDSKNLDAIKSSLRRFGQQKPIVVNEKGIVIAGNGTLTAARALGWDSINIVKTVLEGSEATAYAIADNRTGELAEWDEEALAKQLSALQIEDEALVEAAGFSDAELTALVDEVTGITEGNTDPDEVPEVPEEPTAQPGQIWQLGNHRLMCGNSTSAEDVAALMNGEKVDLVLTDPPYNLAEDSPLVAQGSSAKNYTKMIDAGWDKGFEPIKFISNLPDAIKENCFVLVFTSHRLFGEIIDIFEDMFKKSGHLVWCKTNPMPSLMKVTWTHATELIAFSRIGKPVFNFPETGHCLNYIVSTKQPRADHPTAKPIDLLSELIERSTKKESSVLDLFLGSGSTLIACEQTGRKCYGMELSPAYCDVIIKRWEDFTGQTAELVNG